MLSNFIFSQPRLHTSIIHDFQPQCDAAITIKAFLIWSGWVFLTHFKKFFLKVHEVKGLGPFSLLVQVNLVTSILQGEFVKSIQSPSYNCHGKYCHVLNTLKPIFTFILLFFCFYHFHCMTSFTSMIDTNLE